MGPNLKEAIDTKDVNMLRLKICEAFYISSLKLVHLKVAKSLANIFWTRLVNNFDSKEVIDTLDTHAIACFSQNEGKLCFL